MHPFSVGLAVDHEANRRLKTEAYVLEKKRVGLSQL